MSIQNTYINAFNLIPGIGPAKLYLLWKHFNNFEKAWNVNEAELGKAKLPPKLIENILSAREKINPEDEYKKLQKQNIQIITINDSNFPENLKKIPSPPFLLYVRGNIKLLNNPSVTVVGSRKISDYGKHSISTIIRDIAKSGITIVSGLALGTDAYAHREALDVGGTTVAVLGGGIDDTTITPHSHINLAKQILESNGAIISEYPVGTEPNRGTFPARNRIMAGLTDATIIIEATEKSGTLITAQHAHEFDKKLFALPGSIFTQNSVGPNALIRDKKATPLLCNDDMLNILKASPVSTSLEIKFTNDAQKALYKTIKKHPSGVNINTLIKKVKLDGSAISSELTMMEIDGVVKNIGNQTFITQ